MMKKWRRTVAGVFCVAGMALLALVGCGPGQEEGPDGPQQEERPDAVIGVSVLTFSNPFFHELADAIADEAAKYNYKVIITDGDFDSVRQDQQVADFITQQVNAIVLCPCDSEAVGATIAKANAAGIPVFTADIASLAEQGEVVCHVATDNYEGGRKAAEAVIEVLNGSGKVAILDYPVIESVIMRTDGFHDVIDPLSPAIEIVATLPGDGEKAKSKSAAEDILQSHPDLDVFFCVNDPSALGAVVAIERAQMQDQVSVVGFDAQLEARLAVRKGLLYATVTQYPKQIGAKTADAVHRYLLGEEVEREILIPAAIYRKADADADPELADAQ